MRKVLQLPIHENRALQHEHTWLRQLLQCGRVHETWCVVRLLQNTRVARQQRVIDNKQNETEERGRETAGMTHRNDNRLF